MACLPQEGKRVFFPCGHRLDDFEQLEKEHGYAAYPYVEVEVRTVAGTVYASIRARPDETVGELKQRLFLCAAERRVGRLIYGYTPLSDNRRLEECLAGDGGRCPGHGALALTLVCTGPSSLASHLERLEHVDGEGSGLTDVADSVFQAEYQTSARHQPRAADILVALPRETRTQVVGWLGMACEATLIDDALLHGAVLTLDRYAASYGRPLDEASLLKLSLASLCTEMKLTNEDDFPCGHWQRVLLHLSQDREHLPAILAAEADMLRRLNFLVGVPTPLTFMTGLGMRLAVVQEDRPLSRSLDGRPGPSSPAAALHMGLARMLMELALFDTELEYGYAPAVLATSALGAALLVLGPLEDVDAAEAICPQAPPACLDGLEVEALRGMQEIMLNDLASYCPGMCGLDVVVRQCERQLLEFWRQCAEGAGGPAVGTACGDTGAGALGGRLRECYEHLRQRHARSRRNALIPGRGTALLTLRPEWGLERYYALNSDAMQP